MREKIKFNDGWLFSFGEDKVIYPTKHVFAYLSAKTERRRGGPASKGFDYSGWSEVRLPHDYMMGEPYDEEQSSSLGYRTYKNAWYIKKFKVAKEDEGKRLCVYFEGVATEATVYLNGCRIKHSFTGTTPFEADITDVAEYGAENTLAVFVGADNHESWWYEGAGIHRDVWLVKTDLLSVDLDGYFLKPVYEGGKWRVDISVTLRNDGVEDKSATVRCTFGDGSGKEYSVEACAFVPAKDKATATASIEVDNPHLWSPDDAHLYSARATVMDGAEVTDEVNTRFGFRYVQIDAENGFRINGKRYFMHGVCGHADCGLTGRYVPDSVHRHKIRLLKEMGANAYRCSHYPQSEAFMNALDEEGMIVIAETRWYESTEEGIAQLEALIRRDRNHPSVMFWSIGNEESFHCFDQGVWISNTMITKIKRLDDSRPVTQAVDDPKNSTVFGVSDVIGINYNLDGYDVTHEKYPQKAVIATEYAAVCCTRGYYGKDDPDNGLMADYDHDNEDGYFLSLEKNAQFFAERPWVIGSFKWIGIDHVGEATWPATGSKSGAIDAYLQKKEAFYQFKSYSTDEPMVHLLPHWNWSVGDTVKVWAYTNASEVELILNGKSLGKREVARYSHAEWSVEYEPGTIEARAYIDGKLVATDVKVTAGAVAGLKLVQENTDVISNGEDMAIFTCIAVDQDGNEAYNAEGYEVTFSTAGDCMVFSTASDSRDHTSVYNASRRMWAGRISVAVLLGKKGGKMTLTAECEGIKGDVIEIKTL